MKHPRVWAVVLIAVAAPVMLLGASLAFGCYIPAATGCFATFDTTRGGAMLIVAGVLILGAIMLLTTARARRLQAARSE